MLLEGKGESWCRAIEGYKKRSDAFKSKISYAVGNGRRIRFWKDI